MSIKYHPNIDLDKLHAFDAKSHKSEVPPELFHEDDKQYTNRPTNAEKSAIKLYTSEREYHNVNSIVSNGTIKLITAQPKSDIITAARNLHNGFTRLKLNGDKTLYRGIKLYDADAVAKIRPGKVFVNKRFVSTSTSREMAKDFGNVLLHIFAPKGTPAIKVGKSNSDFNESEIILPAHSHFLVHHVKKDGNSTHIFASWIGRDEETANKNIK